MDLFNNENIDLKILKRRAYYNRWADYEDGVIPLTQADPDFKCASEIQEAIIDYTKEGYFLYTPKKGLPEFIDAIADTLNERKNENINRDFVLPIDSVARGLFIVASSVLEEGDEAIVFDPVDHLFKESVLAAGATPVMYPANIVDGKIDLSKLEEYITPKTKLITLCNPHNPLGKIYPREDLDGLLALANKYDLWVINDEIWSDIVYSENDYVSLQEFGVKRNKKTITLFGFSKSFAVAGLRIGCIYCNEESAFNRVLEKSDVLTTAGGICSISQIAGIACLKKSYYWVDEFVKHLEKNRDYALERIEAMPLIKCEKPNATFLLFPDISETRMDSKEFADYLLKEEKLAIVPGTNSFFGERAKGHIRICFATSREILAEGLNRLEKALLKINTLL